MAKQETALALRDAQGALDLLDSQVDVIRSTIAPGYSDQELAMYLWYCQRANLDPFTREIHTWKDKGGRVIICMGIDSFRKRAASTGQYAPGGTRYEADDHGKLLAAYVTVRRWMPAVGEWIECEEGALLAEFDRGLPVWRQMPHVMLAKCAEARALRRAFPAELGGLYAREEIEGAQEERPQSRTSRTARLMDQVAPIETTAEVVLPTPTPPPQSQGDTPRAAVMRQGITLCKMSGLNSQDSQSKVLEIVEAEKAAGRVPEDSTTWTTEHAKHLINCVDVATRPEEG